MTEDIAHLPIDRLSLDEIVRFVESKFNMRLSVDSTSTPANTPVTPSFGTSTEVRKNPSVISGVPPPPPLPTPSKGIMNKPSRPNDSKSNVSRPPMQQGFNHSQQSNTTLTSFNAKQSWAPQPQQQAPNRIIQPSPQQNLPPPRQQVPPAPQPRVQQQQLQSTPQKVVPQENVTNNVPPVSFYNKTSGILPQQQTTNAPPRPGSITNAPIKSNVVPKSVPTTVNTTTVSNSGNTSQQSNISQSGTTSGRKPSVLDRWTGFQNQQKVSPGMEEALRLTAHVNVKERREEIERLMKAVESKFTDHDFSKIAKEAEESQKQSMMKSITATKSQQGSSGQQDRGLQGSMGQHGIGSQVYSAPPQEEEEEEPSMVNIPDTLLYSLQINTILQLLAMRQWKQAKQNLRALEPYVQQGTREDIFVRIVWSVFYNNYAVDLANQNNFRKAATKAQKGQSLAESIGIQNFRFIDHEYSYWAVLLNTSAIIAQTLHREMRHVESARVHANAYNALIGVQRTTNPHSISTMNKTKMYAVNAIIFGIHAMDKNLLASGVDLLYPLIQYDMNLRPLLGHGYKNIGILELKSGNNDAAKRWFDAAMTV